MAREDIIFQAGPEEIVSGLHPSLPFTEAPLWQDGENVVFTDGAVRPAVGQFIILTKLEGERGAGILQAEDFGSRYLVWGTPSSLFRWPQGGAVANISIGPGYAGITDATTSQRATTWSFVQWGRTIVATNGVDTPQISQDPFTSGLFQNIITGGEFTTAEVFRPLRDFLLAFNTNVGVDVFNWSNAGNPNSWVPTAASEAGSSQLRAFHGPVIAVEELGDGLAVYGEDEIHHVTFIGAPLFIGERHLLSGVGAVSKEAVVAVGRIHYGFGPRGIWQTDGFEIQYADKPSIHDFVFENINLAQISKAVAWHDAGTQQVFFSYPSADVTYNDRTIAWNYQGKFWTKLAFGRSAATNESTFPFVVSIDRFGNVYGQTDTAQPITQEGVPLALDPISAILSHGFGMLGFGQLGFGGTITVAG